ncbi:DUF2278 family protein [Streptosporangium sp. NBC_01756]|uniref:DUF2278 family protein n=1 Tax=Streptosporangium sp. NBC_01756 TaxID=2975950 RepID=UPI002DD9EB55|nr:DUF2278 family protein [Streptosporangium sp. NBC_01756]WSC90706.1 YukJ family protein [Streptosporangium sp. NBC_01756]
MHLTDQAGTSFRVAVNVKSQETPSDLLQLVVDDFRHPVTQGLPRTAAGWTVLPSRSGGAALDYIRGNLFDPAAVRPLPPDLPGVDNDLADRLDHYVQRAIADPDAIVYAFGERWGPEPATPDKVFGFRPGNGVHDIHMNQGNSGRFRGDDGVWQDGGLLLYFPAEPRWVAIFLAFQSQSWHTDDATGHTLDGAPVRPGAGEEPVRVLAALVNPAGPAPEPESVLVINASPDPVDLTGWRLADQQKNTFPLPPGPLAPGTTLTIAVAAPFALGNGGGVITVLDAAGLKVHGVSYTTAQGRREGWTVTF